MSLGIKRPKCSPSQINTKPFCGIKLPIVFWGYFCNFQETAQRKQSPNEYNLPKNTISQRIQSPKEYNHPKNTIAQKIQSPKNTITRRLQSPKIYRPIGENSPNLIILERMQENYFLVTVKKCTPNQSFFEFP
jgi:hypothetical protein